MRLTKYQKKYFSLIDTDELTDNEVRKCIQLLADHLKLRVGQISHDPHKMRSIVVVEEEEIKEWI